MRGQRFLVVAAWVLAALVPLGVARAKGVVEIFISGPGLAGEVKVTDSQTMAALVEMGGPGVPTNLLPVLGQEFYAIRMSIGDGAGKVFATNVYHYYPDPEGGPGYVLFYDVDGGFSDAEGRWHRARSGWDAALRLVLQSHGVDLAVASLPAVQPQAETTAAAPAGASRPAVILGLALAAVAVAAALGLRRFRLQASPRHRE